MLTHPTIDQLRALKLDGMGKLLGGAADGWLGMQQTYDLRTREKKSPRI